jgi:DNA-binding response OmpR family regulator
LNDEPNMAGFVTRALTQRGYIVEAPATASAGLELAGSTDYDLMLVDLLLPGVDGVRVLREALRARPGRRVVIMSAISDVDTNVRCLELGALDYLVKPIMLGELIARIRSRLRHGNATAAAERVLRAGGVELDLGRRSRLEGCRAAMARLLALRRRGRLPHGGRRRPSSRTPRRRCDA